MKISGGNWRKSAGLMAVGIFGGVVVYACVSAWSQTAPGLSITASNSVVSLTVTNGTSNGQYQIYFTEFLEPEYVDWNLFTNGALGQTNFSADMSDFEQGFFKAQNNTNFVPPSLTVIIQSPLNGSVIQ